MFFSGCKNPFAPNVDFSEDQHSSSISDLSSVDGIFQNLQYSYSFKDTTIYGQMIAEDYIFIYRDYDKGFDVSWGRNDEMKTTFGLFQNTERVDLIWNNIVLRNEDSTLASIIRGFNLTITFNPTDIVRVDGRANLLLKKDIAKNKWQITKWVDESNF